MYFFVDLRGTGANIIILEEASHMKSDVFRTVVVPIMGVNNTSILAISTPDDSMNYYTQLMSLTDNDTGDLLFFTIQIGLACADCMTAGIAAKCTHRTEERLPPWKSAKRQRKIRRILARNKDTFAAEILGQVTASKYLFARQDITNFTRRPRYALKPAACKILHTGIDPAGGAESSDTCVMTISYDTTMDEYGQFTVRF